MSSHCAACGMPEAQCCGFKSGEVLGKAYSAIESMRLVVAAADRMRTAASAMALRDYDDARQALRELLNGR